jgi:hypothetical protein
MPSNIIDAKAKVQAATHEVFERYNDLLHVHNRTNRLLEGRANKIERTKRAQGVVGVGTSACVVADLLLTGGLGSILLGSTKIAALLYYNSSLNTHNKKANEVLESERTVTLAFLQALKILDVACSHLRQIGRLSSHINTVSIVGIAFSPGGRMVLTDLALKGLQQAIASHPKAALDMGTSPVTAAINLVEAVGVETSFNAIDFVAAGMDFVPVLGLVLNIRGLMTEIQQAKCGSEAARALRVILVTRRKQFKPMMEYVSVLHECGGINSRKRNCEACMMDVINSLSVWVRVSHNVVYAVAVVLVMVVVVLVYYCYRLV